MKTTGFRGTAPELPVASRPASRRNRSGWMAVVAVSGVLVLAAGLSACDESRTGVMNAAVDDNNTALDNSAPGVPLAPPTLDELVSRLSLTPEQKTVVSAALQRWQTAQASHRGSRPFGRDRQGWAGRRGGSGRGGFGHPGQGGFGRGQEGMGRGGNGHGPGHPGLFGGRGEPPVITFLGDVSGTLSSEQFVSLVQFLVERRGEPADHPAGARGHIVPPAFRRFAQENDLSDSQKQELRNAFTTAAEGLAELRKDILEGTVSGDAIRTRAASIRDQLARSARSTLGDETCAKFVALMAGTRTKIADRRLDNDGKQIDHRVDVLARLLVLTDEQKTQVRAAINAAVPELKTLLTGIKDGTVPFQDAVYRAWQIASSTDEAIRAALNADQLARYTALRSLIAEHPMFLRIYL